MEPAPRSQRLRRSIALLSIAAAAAAAAPSAASAGGGLSQLAVLTPSDSAASDSFGQATAISGEVVAVGAPGIAGSAGAVYLYLRPAGGWTDGLETARLTPSDPAPGRRFGQAVAIDGETVVVGAPGGAGAVYVFVRPPGGWTDAVETAKLIAGDGFGDDELGFSVAIDGDTVVAGAPSNPADGTSIFGAAYVYQRPPGGWVDAVHSAKLTASDAQRSRRFGNGVGIDGGLIAVGANNRDDSRGAVYVFTRPNGGWATATQTAILTASDAERFDQLGWSVAVAAGTVAAGAALASYDDPPGTVNRGRVYLFEQPAGGWADGTESARLTASDGAGGDQLGSAVALDGELVVAGAPMAEVAGIFNQGAAYLFARPAGGWADGAQTVKLTAADGDPGDELGFGVATEGGFVVIGARGTASPSRRGSAYVFGPGPACTLAPTFAGLERVTNPAGVGCGGVRLDWRPGSSNCGGPLVYNVYRSSLPGFVPGPGNLIASCLTAPAHLDTTVRAGVRRYYAVRAEDATGNGAGHCALGNQEGNLRRLSGVATRAPVAIFADDMEAGAGGWLPVGLGGDSPWVLTTASSHSPTHSWFGADGTFCHKWLETAQPVDVPGSSGILTFHHRHDLAAPYDAGVLEYSLAGGAGGWHDVLEDSLINRAPPGGGGGQVPANPRRFLAGGYAQVTPIDHPDPDFVARPSWSGTSGPFSPVVVDLADFADLAVRWRWRLRCDGSLSALGWFVDDVAFTYGADCAAVVFADGFEAGSTAAWSAAVD